MGPKFRQTYLELINMGRGVGPLCPRGLPRVFGPHSNTAMSESERKGPCSQTRNYLIRTKHSSQLEPVVYPSMYWVLCPLARHRISSIEASGGIARIQALLEKDPEKMSRLKLAHENHKADFIARGGDPQLDAAVGGGTGKGLKCLHTHYAHFLASGNNVVGELVANELEHLPQCKQPCVTRADENSDFETNKHWRLPGSTT